MTKLPHTDLAADAAADYRASHLARGDSYDATLATVPFDAYMAELERRHLRRLVPALFAAPPRYLDFACGTGRVLAVVAPMAAESIGVDVSPSMLEQARRKCPTVRFVEADITAEGAGVEAGLGQFDLITSFRFFGNAQNELRTAVLRGLHRLLRADGRLIVNSHRNPFSFASMLHRLSGGAASGMDLHYFKLKALLHDAGFEVVETHPIGAWMYRFALQDASPDAADAQRREQRFKSPALTPFAPDAIVVARKKRS